MHSDSGSDSDEVGEQVAAINSSSTTSGGGVPAFELRRRKRKEQQDRDAAEEESRRRQQERRDRLIALVKAGVFALTVVAFFVAVALHLYHSFL